MIKTSLKLLLALSLLTPLSGCMSRMAHDDAGSRAEAEALVKQFAEHMTQGRESALVEISSTPFWADKWLPDMDALRAEIPQDSPGHPPILSDIQVRIYPLADLAALRPKAYLQIIEGEDAWLKDLYVAAVALDLKETEAGESETESGFLLLRRVNGAWKLAGLLEE